MYNSEIKQKYINSQTSKIRIYTATTLFNILEKTESALCKDFYNFNSSEMYKSATQCCGGSDIRGRKIKISVLRDYVKWCYSAGLTTEDMSSFVYSDILDERHWVNSPKQLAVKLDYFYDPLERQSVDVISRAYLWMGFMGISKKQAVKVCSKDVHLLDGNSYIEFDGRRYLIYDEAKPVFKLLLSMRKMYSYTTSGVVRTFERPVEREILRSNQTGEIIIRVLDHMLKRRSKVGSDGVSLIYSFMYKSGVYFRAYELEKKGVMLTPSKLSGDIQGRYDEKNKLSLIDKKEIWKEHKLNDVLNEYIMWKRTFFDKD